MKTPEVIYVEVRIGDCYCRQKIDPGLLRGVRDIRTLLDFAAAAAIDNVLEATSQGGGV